MGYSSLARGICGKRSADHVTRRRDQEFDIALGAGDRAGRQPIDAPAAGSRASRRPRRRRGRGPPDRAPRRPCRPRRRPASNCGLISATSRAAGLGEAERDVEHLGETDEAGVADDEVDRLGDVRGGEDARVGLLVDDDARSSCRSFQASWLVPTSTAIDASPRRAGSSTSVKPPVEQPTSSATAPATSQPKWSSAVGQLDPAARHPGMVAPAHLERGVGRRAAGRPCRSCARRKRPGPP